PLVGIVHAGGEHGRLIGAEDQRRRADHGVMIALGVGVENEKACAEQEEMSTHGYGPFGGKTPRCAGTLPGIMCTTPGTTAWPNDRPARPWARRPPPGRARRTTGARWGSSERPCIHRRGRRGPPPAPVPCGRTPPAGPPPTRPRACPAHGPGKA